MSTQLAEPTTGSIETTQTAGTDASATEPARKKTARRWPWIVAIVLVAAVGATTTGIAMSQGSAAQAELAALQEEYAGLETRADISQSSLELIRDHRDRLEVQLEELQAQVDAQ